MEDDLVRQREVAYKQLVDFSSNRSAYYKDERRISLDALLAKDVIMFAARGVKTSVEFAHEAFRAIESSSEETVMGNRWQQIVAAISSDTLDTGDLTTLREGALWVCELKSQRNTTNSSSFPQELRELREKVRLQSRYQRASKQPIKAAFCILKSNKSVDEMRVFKSGDLDTTNRDLDGFEYRYLEGKSFWQWLVGVDNPQGLIDDLDKLEIGDVAQARQDAIERVTRELEEALDANGLPHTVQGVLELKRLRS